MVKRDVEETLTVGKERRPAMRGVQSGVKFRNRNRSAPAGAHPHERRCGNWREQDHSTRSPSTVLLILSVSLKPATLDRIGLLQDGRLTRSNSVPSGLPVIQGRPESASRLVISDRVQQYCWGFTAPSPSPLHPISFDPRTKLMDDCIKVGIGSA